MFWTGFIPCCEPPLLGQKWPNKASSWQNSAGSVTLPRNPPIPHTTDASHQTTPCLQREEFAISAKNRWGFSITCQGQCNSKNHAWQKYVWKLFKIIVSRKKIKKFKATGKSALSLNSIYSRCYLLSANSGRYHLHFNVL